MPDRLRSALSAVPSRRQFLAGAAAMSLLAACGDDDSDVSGSATPDGDRNRDDTEEAVWSIVRFYGPFFVAGRPNRVPFGLADEDGLLPADASPAEVTVAVVDPDGETVVDGIVAPIRNDGLSRPYYSFEFTPPAEGFYDYTVQTEVGEVLSQVQVLSADDPMLEGLVGVGDEMPTVETPTVDDPRGVDPICTLDPPCDLHEVTVAESLGGGPLVLLVATPAFCQTAVCGPVLEVMIDQMGDFPDVRFIHAEVFKDPENNSTPVDPADFAPVVEELGLSFEPVMYTVGADGVVRERLDYIFDGSEVNEAVQRLVED